MSSIAAKNLIIVICIGVICIGIVSRADAALLSRLNGQAYYDDVVNLTWLADANYAQTSGYDADGGMPWQVANDRAAQLTVGGVGGWRLPVTLQPDMSCERHSSTGSLDSGCTGSEMGDLFYNSLGNPADFLINKRSIYQCSECALLVCYGISA